MVFLKELAEPFVGQQVWEARGEAKGISFDRVKGQVLQDIKTFGKELFFCFPDFALRVHLMLFGKYSINGELNRVLQLGLVFEAGEINFYACDCRLLNAPWEDQYDWPTDVLHPAFDPEKALGKLLRSPGRFICDALLDQTLFAGVGNGLKNEVLFRQRIHPESQVGEIPASELRALIKATQALSAEYLEGKRHGEGEVHWQAYRQKICPRDRVPFLKAKLGKPPRSCYFCALCQRQYLPDW